MRALQLRRNMQSLARAAEIPVCIARAINAPLHFLTRCYVQVGDTAGLEWCAQFKTDIHKSVPWLRWNVLFTLGLVDYSQYTHVYRIRTEELLIDLTII